MLLEGKLKQNKSAGFVTQRQETVFVTQGELEGLKTYLINYK